MVHKPDSIVRFTESAGGLYYHETDMEDRNVVLLNTVKDNMEKYSDRQCRRAERSRELYGRIGCPSDRNYKHLVSTCELKNNPVISKDLVIANAIWGKNVHELKGKTTRNAPTRVITDYVEVPRSILKAQRNVTSR